MEECTRAETGVGAAIAAGSHAEKGTCALLVIADKKIRNKTRLGTSLSSRLKTSVRQVICLSRKEILKRIPTSPNRLVKAVSSPAL